ncbi:glucose-1-phosphate thymidylyltransferase [Salinigranum rubrum]|uniref:Glucose-1-phosphate thymidylyltransferase n=1 Tax=Salinigranum rubrum TaxID=755307 RepID=A0A2I8VK27_9EURY|nr:NDP-sugar synthase [Salinigranum rubrum]AUV81419.1 glucose-1-phosphate thymidylyltransferase [Salinigranum rubrum]
MKAVVLAGGYATRLWPITRHRPKMFLPIGDGTVIDTIFEELEADDRVDEVFVSTNEYFADEFEAFLEESDYEKPTLSVEETVEEDEKFGVVGAMAQLIDREEVDDDLLIVAGDNLISFGLSNFIDYFEEKQSPALVAYDVGSREKAKSYGLVELDGDRVVNFQEKPEDPASTLVSIACYVYPQETLPLFDEYLSNDNNPDEPGWFVQWLQAREDVYAFTFDTAWYDIGTPESYLEAVEGYLEGDNYINDDAVIENSDLGENVHVMAGAHVENATLDRCVVFPNATIRSSDLSDSIVDEEASIEHLDLTESLVGSHSRLKPE